jgi:hypothetical protein
MIEGDVRLRYCEARERMHRRALRAGNTSWISGCPAGQPEGGGKQAEGVSDFADPGLRGKG